MREVRNLPREQRRDVLLAAAARVRQAKKEKSSHVPWWKR